MGKYKREEEFGYNDCFIIIVSPLKNKVKHIIVFFKKHIVFNFIFVRKLTMLYNKYLNITVNHLY